MSQVDIQEPSQDEEFDIVSQTDEQKLQEPGNEHTFADASEDSVAESNSQSLNSELFEPPAMPVQPKFIPPAPVVMNDFVKHSQDRQSSVLAFQNPSVQPVAKSNKFKTIVKRPKTLRFAGEGILVIGLIVLGLSTFKLTSRNNSLNAEVVSLNANPQALVQKQSQTIVNSVGQLMQLPTGETPTIATVSNASQAKEQSSFFKNAENGDKVLMYVKSGEAILYRPSTNQIVLVAPLKLTPNTSDSAVSTKK